MPAEHCEEQDAVCIAKHPAETGTQIFTRGYSGMREKMDCNKAEKLLVEYLYQELSPEKTLEMEKHLEVCDACSKTLENWRAIHRGYQRSEEPPQPAPYMRQRIL